MDEARAQQKAAELRETLNRQEFYQVRIVRRNPDDPNSHRVLARKHDDRGESVDVTEQPS